MSEGANDKLRELWDVADEHLVRYRGDFYPLVVERAGGLHLRSGRSRHTRFFIGANVLDTGTQSSCGY